MRFIVFPILSLLMSLTAFAATFDRHGLENAFSDKLQADVKIISLTRSNDPLDWVADFYDNVQTRQVVLLLDNHDTAKCKLVRNETYNSFRLENCQSRREISHYPVYLSGDGM